MNGAWDELDDGIYRRRFEALDQNIGLIVGDHDLVVIDSRSHPEHARELRAEISQVSPLPVRWLINTHWHWDHCFGNVAFPDSVIVGHRLCRDGLVANGLQRLEELRTSDWISPEDKPYLDEVEIVAPTLVFETATRLWAAGRMIDLRYYGMGHTDADIVVHVGEVTFAGDLVEEGAPPSFGDAYPRSWVRVLREMSSDLRQRVVPGHGDVVDRRFVAAQADEIEAALGGQVNSYPAEVLTTMRERASREP